MLRTHRLLFLMLVIILSSPLALFAAPDAGTVTDGGALANQPDVFNQDWRDNEVGRDRGAGPDAGGYSWRDNAERGVTYEWIDIGPNGRNGTRLNAGDDWNSGTLSLGFSFPWYGTNYDSIRVCSNGWASLDRTASQTTASLAQCPSATAPNALFAVNNYDLNPALANGGGSIYFWTNREDMAVVTWDHVCKYARVDTFQTFQLVLTADGMAKYQYATLNRVDGRHSNIGFENPAGNVGMNISRLQAGFLSEGLAIGIAQHFREYDGPGIAVTPATPAFGDVYIGYDRTISVRAENNGGQELVITGLECDDGAYVLPQLDQQIVLQPFESVSVDLIFRPQDEGDHATTVRVLCNAENAQDGVFTVNVTGNALIPPEVGLDQNSFEEDAVTGDVINRTFNLLNNGGSPLDFYSEVTIISEGQRDGAELRGIRSLGPVRAEVDRDARGGPDGAGYSWRTDAEADGPDYSWVDITGIGQRLAGGDDWNSGPLALGFQFPYYDADWDTIRVISNGWLTFDPAYTGAGTLIARPVAAAAPNGTLLVNNYDQNTTLGGAIYFWTNRRNKAIVSWVDIAQYGNAANRATYQVIITSDGFIKYQYNSFANLNGANSNIGWESPNGQLGASISYLTANFLHNEMALGIANDWHDWIQWTPTEGTIEANASTEIALTLDAAGLNEGDYEADINFLSNDPATPSIAVNVFMSVLGMPVIDVVWEEALGFPNVLDFNNQYPDLFAGQSFELPFVVTNVGSSPLNVEDVSSNEGHFVPVPGNFVLDPGQSQAVTVTFTTAADDAADYNAVITLTSNDADGTYDLNVHAHSYMPPQITLDANELNADLATGEIADRVVTVSNQGGATLRFTTDMTLLQIPQRDKDVRAIRSLAGPVANRDARGGPDAGGYEWRSSDEWDGANYEWIDITGEGQRLGGGDDWNSGVLDLGWNFPWYGAEFDTIRVISNGYITLDANYSAAAISLAQAPSAAAPNAVLAPANFDMNTNTGGALYFWTNNQDMAVVSWEDVAQYGNAANTVKMQIVLTADGMATFQYNNLVNVNGAGQNVCFESPDGNAGMNISYRQADFLHNEMAIGISNNWVDWISWSPEAGEIASGASQDVTVTLNAEGLFEGLYQAGLHILSNDPDDADVEVVVSLNVTGVPVISASWSADAGFPDVMDWNRVYADLYMDNDYTIPLTVSNDGTTDLSVQDIASDDGSFLATPTEFVLGAGESREVTLTFHTHDGNLHQSTVTIFSNADNNNQLSFAVSGDADAPPVIILSRDQIETALNTDENTQETINVANDGDALLRFTTDIDIVNEPGRDAATRSIRSLVERPIARDARGGPDAFEYEWRSNDENDGPDFEWIDISQVGQALNGGDDVNSGVIDIGWTFPYYGQEYTQFRATTNGIVTFDINYASSGLGLPQAPAATAPNALLLVNNFDQNVTGNGTLRFYTNEQDLAVISWDNVQQYGNANNISSYQVILERNGMITYQYQNLQNINGAGQNIGFESPDGQAGLNISRNQANFLHNDLAIGISNNWHNWITWTPEAAEIEAAGDVDVVVTIDATGLIGGDYEARLHFLSNDPNRGDVEVPIFLEVTGIPMVGVNWAEAAGFPDMIDWNRVHAELYTGFSYDVPITVSNDGTALLTVASISSENGVFTANPSQFELAAGASQEVVLTFSPDAEGVLEGIIVVASNAANIGEFEILARGESYNPPQIALDVQNIHADLITGETQDEVINVSNTGSSILNFTTELEELDVGGRDRSLRTIRSLGPVRETPVRDARGGPDAFEYEWRTNDEGDGPSFNWIDVTEIGQNLNAGDDWNSGVLNLGFDVPWYDQNYNTIRVVSNGYVTLGDAYAGSTISQPQAVNAAAPNALLLVANYDIAANNGGGIYFWTNNQDMAVVAWVGVPQYANAGNIATFEVVIESDGMITYQYLDLQNINGAGQNIGFESPDGQAGLNISYRTADFLHNEMAIGISNNWLTWLSLDIEEGSINPNENLNVTATLAAGDLPSGDYAARIHFLSNDPANPDVFVEATISVTGEPMVETNPLAHPLEGAPENLDFGAAYLETEVAIGATISNVGTRELVVAGTESSNGEFWTDLQDGLAIQPGESSNFQLFFMPSDIGARSGTVRIFTNAINVGEGEEMGTVWFDLIGLGQTLPQIVIEPGAGSLIDVEMAIDAEVQERALTISNAAGEGGDDLDWEIFAEPPQEGRDAGTRAIRSFIGGPVRDAAGGPDDMTYSWRDNDEADGPAYEWIEIVGVDGAQSWNLGDDAGVDSIQLGFNFPFYGTDYSQIFICSNGWTSFIKHASWPYSFSAWGQIPNATAPRAWLAPAMADWNQNNGGDTWFWSNGEMAVITWSQIPHINGQGDWTFQLVLFPSGLAKFQYAETGAPDGVQLVAFQNEARDRGFEIARSSQGYLTAGRAIGFGPRQAWGLSWLDIEPTSGSIAAGGSTDVILSFDAAGLAAAEEFNGILTVESNDPANPSLQLDVRLTTVAGGPPAPRHFNNFVETMENHSLLINAVSNDGQPAPTGWEVGVFTPGGVLSGGGVWIDGEQLGIAAWGADVELAPNQFTAGEAMSFKLWDNQADVEVNARAALVDVANNGDLNWVNQGFTVLTLGTIIIDVKTVPFNAGWNLISLNVTPGQEFYTRAEGPDVRRMMEQFRFGENNVSHHVMLMKNERGFFYAPSNHDFNNIPFWNLTEGYLVKMDQATEGVWSGEAIPADADVPIASGWNMIAYFPTYQLACQRNTFYAFSPIMDFVVLAKDGFGRFASVRNNFSNMEPWREGRGYQINASQACVLNYPAAQQGAAAMEVGAGETSVVGRWTEPVGTGANMSVLLTGIAGADLTANDQVAAFSVSGRLVGVGNPTNGMVGLAVWGDDASTETIDGLQNGEAFTLKLWKADRDEVVDLRLGAIETGEGLVYTADGFTAANAVASAPLPEVFYLTQNWPNPFNPRTGIKFGLPEASFVSIRVFDVEGREVATLVSGNLQAGNHTAVWNAEAFHSGVYLVKMETPTFSSVRKVTLIK